MKCEIEKSIISGQLSCPPNKSYTHRAIFLASLAKGESTIQNVLLSADTKATIDACKKFGANIEKNENNLTINGIKEFSKNDIEINAENSGTTIRIAIGISSLIEGKTKLTGDASLKKRPMGPLLDCLKTIGVKSSSNDNKPPLEIIGKTIGGEVTIPGNISSQFISSLMIMAPLTEKGLTINIDGELVSKPYIDATIVSMKMFKVEVEKTTPYKKYKIPPQKYHPGNVTIPSDFSSLAMLLSANVLLGDKLKISINRGDFPQGDEKFLDFLKQLGVKITIEKDIIAIQSPESLFGGKFDLHDTPDLLPPLAILALKSSKPIEIGNVGHARFKETDRIAILARELSKLGVIVDEKKDGMILHRPKMLKAAELNSENDHRMFMAFFIAGLFVGNCKVSHPESVDVSYPNFIEEMKKVGAKVKLVV